jgi:hypothetical protein
VGRNSTLLQVPFLNLMANIKARAGWVQVRIGGNSQESAELVSSLPNGTILAKDMSNVFNPTDTPPLAYTPDLLAMLGNISALTGTRWYLGERRHFFPFLRSSKASTTVRHSIFQLYSL